MSGEGSRGESVLERNLRALFSRAYEPVVPSGAFRARLLRSVEREIAGTGRRPSAAAWRVAAGILALLAGAALAWSLLRGGEGSRGVEEILAGDRAAVRETPALAWRPLTDAELRDGLPVRAGTIELATPPRLAARVDLDRLGGIEAGPSTRIAVVRGADGSVETELDAGSATLDHAPGGPSWRVATDEGALVLADGRLEVAMLASGPERRVRALLVSGSAAAETEPPIALQTGREVYLRDGEVLGLPGLEVAAAGASGRSPGAPEVAGADAPPESTAPPSADEGESSARLRGRLVLPEGTEAPAELFVTLLREVRLPEVSRGDLHRFGDTPTAFAIDGLKAGTWSIFVQAQGSAGWIRRGVVLAEGATVDLEVELAAGSTVRGRVVDAGSRPVEGAIVLVEEDTPTQILDLSLEEVPEHWLAASTSGPDGTFEIRNVAPGGKHLRATHAGFGAGWSEPFEPSGLEPDSTVEVRLSCPGSIGGHVLRPGGAPWAGARVVASLLDTTFGRSCLSFAGAIADAEGRYAIEDLPPGAFVVLNTDEAAGPGGPVSPSIVQANVRCGERSRIDLPDTLRGTAVEGRLLRTDGGPLEDLDVTLYACDPSDSDWKAARSDAAGRFRFPDIAPGAYVVYVGGRLGEQFVRQATVDVPAAPVFRTEIRVGAGSITGQVADAATGLGLARSVVVLEVEVDGGYEFAAKTVCDVTGRYTLERLPGGRYRAIAYATVGRYGQETLGPVEVGRGTDALVLDFAMQSGAELAVRVEDAAGLPVQGAHVRFVDEAGRGIEFSQSDRTDGNGVLRTGGIRPGRWVVSVDHARSEVVVDLAPGEERELTIRLPSKD